MSKPGRHGADPAPGSSIAHFRIVDKLGEGGMGVVYRAVDEKLGRTVALKVLHPEVANNKDRRRRFVREGRLAAAMNHPCIASVFEVGEAGARIYIAMELVEGKSLRSLVGVRAEAFGEDMPPVSSRPTKGRALPVEEAMRVGREIARGLGKAHETGVVHRDLKPDNVIVGADAVKILDFGLAKATEGSTASTEDDTEVRTGRGKLLGTPAYMSPEQAKGKTVEARSDIFSFGIVLYEMVTGMRPFVGDTWQETIIAVCRGSHVPAIKRAPGIPADLDKLIESCLAKEPEDRPASCRDIVAELNRLLGGGSATAGPAPSPLTNPTPPAVPLGPPPAKAAATQPQAAPPATRGTWVVAVIVGLTAALGAAGWARFSAHAPAGPDPSALAAPATAAPKPMSIVDAPPPEGAGKEALREYRAGLQAIRDDDGKSAKQHLGRAVALDSELPAADLRRAALLMGEEREQARAAFGRATERRAALSSRDRLLLDALSPLLAIEPADAAELDKRLAALGELTANDAEMAYWIAVAGAVAPAGDPGLARALASAKRAETIDPSFAAAFRAEGDVDAAMGRFDEALRALDEALRVAPTSTASLRRRVQVLDRQGACEAVATEARRWIAAAPEDLAPYDDLANALVAQGRSIDTARGTLLQKVPKAPEAARARMQANDELSLAAIGGDFAGVEAKGAELEAMLVREPGAELHAGPAQMRVEGAVERGDSAKAAQLAEDLRKARETWTPAAHLPAQGPLAKLGACHPLVDPFAFVRAGLALGQELEAKGDKAGACGAYQKVLERWGQAKPRSVTAEKARQRAAALACGR
jgi:eukaryotic-like serine/threonine-protein kinase